MTSLREVKQFKLVEASYDGENSYPVSIVGTLPKVDEKIIAFAGKARGIVTDVTKEYGFEFVGNRIFYRVYFLLDSGLEHNLVVTIGDLK